MARLAAAQPAPKQTRAQLEKLIGDLARRDRELLAEQLKLENAKIEPVAEASLDAQVAATILRLVDGDAVTRPAGDPARRLHDILVLRRAIPKAIELANTRLIRVKCEEAAEIGRDIEKAWADNLKKIVAAIFEIKDAAETAERLQAEWRHRVGLPVVPPLSVGIAELVALHGPLRSLIEAGHRIGVVQKDWR